MRRSALAALFVLCTACAPNGEPDPAPQPEARPRQVGVLVPASRGRCTSVVVGTLVRRVCLPGRKPQPADTTATDTVRTDAPGSRVAAGGGR